MFRLIGFLVMVVVGASGYIAIDFNNSKRWATGGLTFSEYLGGLSERVSGPGASSGNARGLPTELVDMLPKPPEDWTMRPATKDDLTAFLPKKRGGVPKNVLAYLEAVTGAAPRNAEAVAMTYEKGERKVIFQLIRYPDAIFTGFAAMEQRVELQTTSAMFSDTPFMTVRGLDVSEDLLPDEVRARYFFADVGAQIHLRVLASDRMKDKEMVPLFETLHVAAMNADVVDKQDGLGDVPVLVLASVMDEATRAAYEADMAEREATLAAEHDAERQEAEAKVAAEAERAATEEKGGSIFDGLFGATEQAEPVAAEETAASTVECKKGTGGSKKCSIISAAPAED